MAQKWDSKETKESRNAGVFSTMYSASFLAIATYCAYAASEVDFLIHWKSGGQVRVQVIMAISFLKAMAVSSVLIFQGCLLQHAVF